MSSSYSATIGIGINAKELIDYINPQKCIDFISVLTEGKIKPELKGFDINDYLCRDICNIDSFAELLTYCDETGVLLYSIDNEESREFLLYSPSYPWERCEDEPESIEDVHKLIIKTVKVICDLSDEEIEKLIDDEIYFVTWG